METKRKLPMELVRAGDVEMDRRSKRNASWRCGSGSDVEKETRAADGIGQRWRCGSGSDVDKETQAGDAEVDRMWKRKRRLPMELVGAGDAEVDRTWKRNASCRWSWSALAMRRGKRCRFGGKVTGSVMDRENE